MKKFVIALLLILSIGTVSAGTYSIVTANYPILVNGERVQVQPYNLNGTTLLPIRAVSDALGVPINWTGKAVEINTVDVEKLKEACVMIYGSDGNTYEQGSGVYVDYDEVLTANHVIDEGRTQARTQVDKSDPNKMTVTDSDTGLDIAVLKPTVEKKPVKIGDSDEVKIGDKVIFVGSPDGKYNTVVYTTVKSINGRITIDAKLNGGSSGGALFTTDGSLIGILISGDDGLNECYVIPINRIREAL